MSAICSICSVSCDSNSGEVKCCAGCKRFFHTECVKDDADSKKTRSASKEWMCKDCRKPQSAASSVNSSVSSTALTKEFLRKVLEEFKKEMFDELKSFKKEVTELRASMEFLSNAVDSSNTMMKSIQADLSSIKKENIQIQLQNNLLKADVNGLKERLRALEQYSRRTNIEISGIPETPKENIIQIVKDVGSAMGVTLEEGQVTAAHRVPSYKRDRIPSLVVQFQSKVTRDAWIYKYKEKKTLTAKDVNPAYPLHRVYVNEHLSPENKAFLSNLKKKCKDLGYKYAWCKDGRFFVRKTEGVSCQRINSCVDIDELK